MLVYKWVFAFLVLWTQYVKHILYIVSVFLAYVFWMRQIIAWLFCCLYFCVVVASSSCLFCTLTRSFNRLLFRKSLFVDNRTYCSLKFRESSRHNRLNLHYFVSVIVWSFRDWIWVPLGVFLQIASWHQLRDFPPCSVESSFSNKINSRLAVKTSSLFHSLFATSESGIMQQFGKPTCKA